MRTWLLLTVAGLLVGGLEKTSDSSMADTTDRLRGEWVIKRLERWGSVDPKRGSAVFTKDVAIIEIGGDSAPHAYWLDGARYPKAIDLVFDTRRMFGIYSLHGDRLTICISAQPGVRPRELKSDDTSVLVVFQRKKPKKP